MLRQVNALGPAHGDPRRAVPRDVAPLDLHARVDPPVELGAVVLGLLAQGPAQLPHDGGDARVFQVNLEVVQVRARDEELVVDELVRLGVREEKRFSYGGAHWVRHGRAGLDHAEEGLEDVVVEALQPVGDVAHLGRRGVAPCCVLLEDVVVEPLVGGGVGPHGRRALGQLLDVEDVEPLKGEARELHIGVRATAVVEVVADEEVKAAHVVVVGLGGHRRAGALAGLQADHLLVHGVDVHGQPVQEQGHSAPVGIELVCARAFIMEVLEARVQVVGDHAPQVGEHDPVVVPGGEQVRVVFLLLRAYAVLRDEREGLEHGPHPREAVPDVVAKAAAGRGVIQVHDDALEVGVQNPLVQRRVRHEGHGLAPQRLVLVVDPRSDVLHDLSHYPIPVY